MRPVAVLAAVVLVGGACTPTAPAVQAAQILLYVDTDAPLPEGAAGAPVALFDRVRIDLLAPGQDVPCGDCTNEFDITTGDLTALNTSVGLAPPTGVSGYRARVRMFKATFTSALGEPDADSTIDTTVSLPPTTADTVTAVTVMMSTADVGVPVGSSGGPVSATPGAPSSTAVGTWAGAAIVPCAGAGRPGQVCIPGGAFWLGTTVPELPHSPASLALRPRLVTLSPFWLDDREVTVGAYRTFDVTKPDPWSGSDLGFSWNDFCTFTPAKGSREASPLNCIRWEDARAYCRSTGGDLPTEAQWEYASGGLQDQRFVWGEDDPQCGDAIFGHGGGTGYPAAGGNVCLPIGIPGQVPLPLASAGRVRDVLTLPGGLIYDLAGNLEEWTRDDWNAPGEPCWARPGVYVDPWCQTESPSLGLDATVRGGGWLDSGDLLLAAARSAQGELDTAQGRQEEPVLGFRCARADSP